MASNNWFIIGFKQLLLTSTTTAVLATECITNKSFMHIKIYDFSFYMQVCRNVSGKISDANFCDQKCLSFYGEELTQKTIH